MAESGIPGFEYVTWYGLYAPAGTPRDILARLNVLVVRILSEPEMAKRFASQGAEPSATTPEELVQYRRSEFERWRKLIAEMKLKVN